MTGPEMLHEIERREYYRLQHIKSLQLNKLFWKVLVPVMVIVGCLLLIAGHISELWQAFR